MKKIIKKILQIIVSAFVALLLISGLIILSWYLRANDSHLNPKLHIEVWDAVNDDGHNFNTDLILWNDYFYLIYQHSKTHFFDTNSKLVLLKSKDCKKWEKVTEIKYDKVEFRDPKLAVINNTLFLYTLKNLTYDPEPSQTYYTFSNNGYKWSELKEISPKGYLFWKPKTLDSLTWYNTAYWHEHGKSVLLKSNDGINWKIISTIHDSDTNDETALEIFSDSKMIAVARLECNPAWHSGSKNASTLIAYSYSPYTKWDITKSLLTRLDGPALLNVSNRTIAVGRFDPEGRNNWYGISSIFGRKRTAIYEIRDGKLQLLSELPSCGDTSYPGVVSKDDYLYISYYTNEETKDYPWIMGMYSKTKIKIARIKI